MHRIFHYTPARSVLPFDILKHMRLASDLFFGGGPQPAVEHTSGGPVFVSVRDAHATNFRDHLAATPVFRAHACFYYADWSDVIAPARRCLVAVVVYDGLLDEMIDIIRDRCIYPVEVQESDQVACTCFLYTTAEYAEDLAHKLSSGTTIAAAAYGARKVFKFEIVQVYYAAHMPQPPPVQHALRPIGMPAPDRARAPVSPHKAIAGAAGGFFENRATMTGFRHYDPFLSNVQNNERTDDYAGISNDIIYQRKKDKGKGKGKERERNTDGDVVYEDTWTHLTTTTTAPEKVDTNSASSAAADATAVDKYFSSWETSVIPKAAPVKSDLYIELLAATQINRLTDKEADDLILRDSLREFGIKPRKPSHDGSECAWCFIAAAESEAMPCGHVAFCYDCLARYLTTQFAHICPLYECLCRDTVFLRHDSL